jgi:hypothetical protein
MIIDKSFLTELIKWVSVKALKRRKINFEEEISKQMSGILIIMKNKMFNK